MASNKPNNNNKANGPEEDVNENASEAVVNAEALKAELEATKKALAVAQEEAAYKARERKLEEGIIVDPASTQNDLPPEFKREPVVQEDFMNYPGTTRTHY